MATIATIQNPRLQQRPSAVFPLFFICLLGRMRFMNLKASLKQRGLLVSAKNLLHESEKFHLLALLLILRR